MSSIQTNSRLQGLYLLSEAISYSALPIVGSRKVVSMRAMPQSLVPLLLPKSQGILAVESQNYRLLSLV